MKPLRIILLHIRSSRLRAAIRRLLEQSVDATVESSDDGLSTTDMALHADVLVVDVTDRAFAEQVLDVANCARLKPYVIAFSEEPEQLRDDLVNADAKLVQFFASAPIDLAKNLVSLVTEALRRRFIEVDVVSPVALEQNEKQWIESLLDDGSHPVPAPPPGLTSHLRQALPPPAARLIEAQRWPRCLAFRSEQHLPWECLLPPNDVDRDGAAFVPVRLFTSNVGALPERKRSEPFRAVHVVFPTVDVADLRAAGNVIRGRSGIRGDRGLAALQRLAQRVQGVCAPVHGAKTPQGIGIACAGAVDLLHIACHARVSDGVGELLLAENAFGDAQWVTGRDLAMHLGPVPPRVVVLEACGSGLGPQGIAAELVGAGVEAVVAFQVRPAQDLAAVLIERFYRGLEETCSIDYAVWKTRAGPGPPVAWLGVVLAIAREASLDVLGAFCRE